MKHSLIASLTLAASLVSACSVHETTDDVVRIKYDEGGDIETYARHINEINRSGQTVVIDGKCMSACTMYLGADRVCVTPRAEFLFHGSIPYPGETKAQSDKAMTNFYSPEMRAWFYGEGIHKIIIVFERVPLDKVMSLSGVGYCNKGDKQ